MSFFFSSLLSFFFFFFSFFFFPSSTHAFLSSPSSPSILSSPSPSLSIFSDPLRPSSSSSSSSLPVPKHKHTPLLPPNHATISSISSSLATTLATTTPPTGLTLSSSIMSSFSQTATAVAAGPLRVQLGLGVLGVALVTTFLEKFFFKKWRAYDKEMNSVGREYDAWTRERILEYYWGEHIHLGYYDEKTQKEGYLKKNFIEAKYDFVDRMLEFSQVKKQQQQQQEQGTTEENPSNANESATTFPPAKVLDVGCGIGGTTRHLAKILGPNSQLTGITLSGEQVKRATELATEQGISNVQFKVMDALKMDYPDNSFDFVWACESGEHMPDKKAYVDEMVRVLKPGGTLVIACWCQRDTNDKPFTLSEQKRIDFMCTEWSHPYFISIKQFANNLLTTNVMEDVTTDDWYQQTLPSWRHSIWVGIFDPIFWLVRPHLWIKCARDAFTLNVFHNAFKDRLMGYGMIRGVKKQ